MAGQITRGSIDRVREAADMVEVVSAHTDLRRSGDRFTGLCPFHDERSPSFSVQAAEKLYYCFGCGAGGDVFKFVEEKQGLTFPEATEWLAERFGVELDRGAEDPEEERARKRRARLGEVLDRVGSFYSAYLWNSSEAAKAREYLAERGLGEEVLREFGVGFAPSAWDTVLIRGQEAGFKPEELERSGLLVRNQKGSVYDRFRSRITFPIANARGRPLGFGARALRPDQKPKYVNSPEGELFRKKEILFAIDKARPAIAKRGRAVVVEGYTDVLALHQAGIGEAVAVMGTAITPDQVRQLAQHTEEVVLALDADRAGREAMLRAQGVARGKRVRLRVASMPEGEDPADMLAADAERGAERFRELISTADELPVFHVRALLSDADLESPTGRDRALDEVAPVLAAMPESITRTELEREVIERLRADAGLVSRRVREAAKRGAGRSDERPRPAAAPKPAMPKLAPAPARGQSGGPGDPGPDPMLDGDPGPEPDAPPSEAHARVPVALSGLERRERALLAMCVAAPNPGREMLGRLTNAHLTPLARRARDWLLEHLEDPASELPHDDEELVAMVSAIVLEANSEPASPEAIEVNFLQLEQAMLERKIAAAERGGGDPPVTLHRQRAELAERIIRARG
ncbi:DNA primase [Thermoleophilia bacterium SCSIO 60948]|nr:DNA primase [Thermoleophilia bacterium SCSIO 60948]